MYPEYQNCIDWHDSQFMEHMFSRSEADAKIVLDEIVDHPEKIHESEIQSKLIIYMHDLAYRVESYRDLNDYINKTTYDWISKMNLSKNSQKSFEKRYGPHQSRKEQLFQVTSLSAVLRTANKLQTEYEWFWGQTLYNGELILSDDPLLSLKLDYPEIVFPVSRTNAIILRKTGVSARIMGTDKPENGIINISIRNSLKYDLLQLCAMNRYVFGSERILKLLITLWKCRRNGEVDGIR